MRWERHGRVLAPGPVGDWGVSHAMVPVVRTAGEERELLFSVRDDRGRSHTARAPLTVDADGVRVGAPDPVAVLRPGPLGAFDDSGAMASCVVRDGDRELLFYIGWSLGVTVPFATYVGLAVSQDGGRTFARVSDGPVIGRSTTDPYLATSPWVLHDEGRWRMWYASGARWEATPDGPKHFYRILYAESPDGIEWHPTGHVCIDFADADEYAIARPCVVREDGRYRMWFSCRGPAYRVGYAESDDGLVWHRDDERGGFGASGDGWESRSVEYAHILDHRDRRWMLYNGNGYGETGIGLAALQR